MNDKIKYLKLTEQAFKKRLEKVDKALDKLAKDIHELPAHVVESLKKMR